jgi:hypothetical protein
MCIETIKFLDHLPSSAFISSRTFIGALLSHIYTLARFSHCPPILRVIKCEKVLKKMLIVALLMIFQIDIGVIALRFMDADVKMERSNYLLMLATFLSSVS